MSAESFADLVQGKRLAAGLSREALAYRSGLSYPAVRSIENGHRPDPRLSSVARLARALDLSAADIIRTGA